MKRKTLLSQVVHSQLSANKNSESRNTTNPIQYIFVWSFFLVMRNSKFSDVEKFSYQMSIPHANKILPSYLSFRNGIETKCVHRWLTQKKKSGRKDHNAWEYSMISYIWNEIRILRDFFATKKKTSTATTTASANSRIFVVIQCTEITL